MKQGVVALGVAPARHASGVEGGEGQVRSDPGVLISLGNTPKIDGFTMKEFCHRENLPAAQRSLLGFGVLAAHFIHRRDDD